LTKCDLGFCTLAGTQLSDSAAAHLRQEPPGRPLRYNPPSERATEGCERASGAEIDPPVDVECTGCGCAFVNTAAFDAHCPDGTCRKPPDVGLVVANRGVVWLESARHLERP
jgi:hypothetical protein